MSGLCHNCRQPMAAYEAGEHVFCGVYCAVQGNAPIEGLSDVEIVEFYVSELTDAVGACDDQELVILQRGLGQMLYWLTEADASPGRRELARALERFLKKSRA